MCSLAILTLVQSVPIEVSHHPIFTYHTPLAAAIYKTPTYLKPYDSEDSHDDAPANYDFSYSVHDDHTGDIKSQEESRRGDAVHGKYELIDSDGYKRIVEYTADKHTGFNAVVHRVPTNIKIPIPKPYNAPKEKLHVHYTPTKYVSAAPVPVHYAPAKYVSAAPVHYAPAKYVSAVPVHYAPAKFIAAEGTHVSVSLPTAQYKY